MRRRLTVLRPKCNIWKTQEHSQSWDSGGSDINFPRLFCPRNTGLTVKAIKEMNLSSVLFFFFFLSPTYILLSFPLWGCNTRIELQCPVFVAVVVVLFCTWPKSCSFFWFHLAAYFYPNTCFRWYKWNTPAYVMCMVLGRMRIIWSRSISTTKSDILTVFYATMLIFGCVIFTGF